MAHTTTHINRSARPDVAGASAWCGTGGAGLGGPGWLRAGFLQRPGGLPRPGGVSRAGAGGLAGVAGSA